MRLPRADRLFPHDMRLGWRATSLLAALALLIFLPGFTSLPPIDRDEARFAQATRQMLETGDYIDIRFQNAARYKKPIGIYWLQAVAVKAWQSVTGTAATDVIWPYRLPSLVAAIASATLTGALGALLFGARAGFAAGLLLALSLIMNFEARAATTDAALLASVLTAQYVLATAYCRAEGAARLDGRLALIGWGAVGIGILIKGPIILLVLGGTVAALAWIDPDRRWLKSLHPRTGALLSAAIVLPWLMLIIWKSKGAFVQDSVGQDLLGKVLDGETTGRVPPGFHTLMLWVGFWPGSLLLLSALPWIWAHRRDKAVQFCLAWTLPTWIAFEIPMTKLPHYVLPAYPALAMLGASWLIKGAPAETRWSWDRLIAGIWALVSGALSLTVLVLPLYFERRLLAIPALLSMIAMLSLGAAYLLVAGRSGLASLALGLSGVAFISAATLTLADMPFLFPSRQITSAIRPLQGCPRTELVSAGFEEPSLVFLAGTQIRFLDGATAASTAAASRCTLAIVESAQEETFLARARELGRTPRRLALAKGLNHANSKRCTLTLYAIP